MRSILPGRPQSSRQALCTVNWDGLRLVAYISGTTIIIFNGRRQVLQSISVDEAGALHSLVIEEQSGRIAVTDNSVVYIYEPFGRDYDDLRWRRTYTLEPDQEAKVTCLSWGSSDELLAAGQRLKLWSFAEEGKPQVIWEAEVSNPIEIALFSPDAGLIASCGQHDRVVKIWRRLSYEQDSTRFDVSYLPHSATVTNLSWRQFWHQEQILENVLYTYSADKNIRVWAHADHFAICTLQKIITLDAAASIQPRRLSMSSKSKNRFSFIIHSRDIARATERALQVARSGTDHALEHLVEIANRSPEICVVLDGLGHMSAWGIENVGLKSKHGPDKFNVALVDGVNISLPAHSDQDDVTQIIAFANGDVSASLCILVHSYSGQIDWYEGSFVTFFDTAAREDRLELNACWSGHDSTIDRMVPSLTYDSFVSMTEADDFTYWSRSSNGTLVRKCEGQAESAILDAVLFGQAKRLALLHSHSISLWDLQEPTAKSIGRQDICHGDPTALSYRFADAEVELMVLFEDDTFQQFNIHLPTELGKMSVGGDSQSIVHKKSGTAVALKDEYHLTSLTKQISFCNSPRQSVFSWSDSGDVTTSALAQSNAEYDRDILSTGVRLSNIAVSSDQRVCALVHADYRTVSIWNSVQHSYEFLHEFTDFSFIHELSWYQTQGGYLLAVQFAYHIAIISQRRYDATASGDSWKVQQIIQTRPHSSNVIGATSWLAANQFAVALANQIIVFDVDTSTPSTANTLPAADTSAVKPKLPLQFLNSSNAWFDPEYLERFLAVDDTSAVVAVLRLMHQEFKFLSYGGEVTTHIGHIYSTMLKIGSSSAITDDEEHDFHDNLTQTEEYVSRISRQQLSMMDLKRLQRTIGIAREIAQNRKSMDRFALIYLYHFTNMIKQIDDASAELRSLPFHAIVYASLSQTQEALLHSVLGALEERKFKLTWSTARSLGLFLFVNDVEVLRLHLESVARAEYNKNSDDKNPVDCSLYYLALDKKVVLQSLWRRTIGVKEKESTMKLLAYNFTQSRWKATALKNAYALLSRRRFEYAAAFFLLGGSLSDAVNVCVNQLNDIQLAIAIARVWTGDMEQRKSVLNNLFEKVIPEIASRTCEARWMLLWTCVQSKDWPRAIHCITQPVDQLLETELTRIRQTAGEDVKKANAPLKALNFRTNEPTFLVSIYQHFREQLKDQGHWTTEIISSREEWKFVLRCASWYRRAGLDWLALRLVSQWRFVDPQMVSVPQAYMEEKDGFAMVRSEPLENVKEQPSLNASDDATSRNAQQNPSTEEKPKSKPPPTQFVEPSADSLLDSFGF